MTISLILNFNNFFSKNTKSSNNMQTDSRSKSLVVDVWENNISVLVLHNQLIAGLVGRQVKGHSSEG